MPAYANANLLSGQVWWDYRRREPGGRRSIAELLLKLYVVEEESEAIRSIVDSDADVVVSSLSYVEAHSGLARRLRDGSVARRDVATLIGAFDADWFQYGKVHVDESILRRAAKLCLKHPVRFLDAIQLATALF